MSKEQVERIRESYEDKVKMGFELFKNSVVFQTTSLRSTEKLKEKQIPQQPEQPKKGILKVLK